MDIVQTETQSVNWRNQPNDYQRRAANTRSRRQAAGRYARPTKAQQAAFAKTMKRDGTKSLSVEEMGLLATMPTLTASQRAEYVEMAQAAIEGIMVNHLLIPVTDDDVEQTINGLFAATDEECAPEGTLQAMIDAADEDSWYDARLQELRDDMEFGDFVRGHC